MWGRSHAWPLAGVETMLMPWLSPLACLDNDKSICIAHCVQWETLTIIPGHCCGVHLFAFVSTSVCFLFASTSEAENRESILVVLLLSALFASFTTQSIKSPLKSGRSRRFRERSALKITQIQNTKRFYTNTTTQLSHLKSVWFRWKFFFKIFWWNWLWKKRDESNNWVFKVFFCEPILAKQL